MRTKSVVVIFLAVLLSACSNSEGPHETKVTEQPFVSGGTIDMQLSGGGYTLRPASGNVIRVTLSGNVGPATAGITIDGANAKLVVKDSPRNNFTAAIEVPKASNLVVNLSGGDLQMDTITGNKDIQTGGGNVQISVGNPNDYASVDASLKAGDLNAGPFGQTRSGLLQNFTWSGPGKYKLHASLGAGNLELK